MRPTPVSSPSAIAKAETFESRLMASTRARRAKLSGSGSKA
jgi:hypothetical protein